MSGASVAKPDPRSKILLGTPNRGEGKPVPGNAHAREIGRQDKHGHHGAKRK